MFSRVWQAWREDRLLRLVLRNTGYLFSANTISTVLGSLYGFAAALLLGPAQYGVLGMVIMFGSTVNRLLSFRMSEMVIRYAGQYRTAGRLDQAAAVIKAGGLAEAITSLVAFGLLVLLAPLGALHILKDPQTSALLVFYGLILLGNFTAETSTAVLQMGGHYRTQAVISLAQTLLTGAWILGSVLTHAGLWGVVTAYMLGKMLQGLALTAAGLYFMKSVAGEDWLRVPFSVVPNWGEKARFALSTNLNVTIQMVIRDSEILWLGYFSTQAVQIGYFKFAQALMTAILMPITPFIVTTYPEISRTIAEKAWKPLRRLLRRTTLMAGVWTVGCMAGLLIFGRWGLGLLKNGEYLPSLPAVLILLVGYGIANILFWNRPLLLGFGKPYYPLAVTAGVGAVKIGLMFLFVPRYGYLAQALLLSGFLTLSVVWIAVRGLQVLRAAERATPTV